MLSILVKLNRTFILLAFFLICTQVFANPGSNTTNQTNKTAATAAPDAADPQTKHYDAAFAVSVKTVLHRLKQGQKITLVDIRSAADFERLKIPGSINVPLFAVKTKPFLKTNPLVLVNAGYGYGRLETECRRLKKTGYRVSILDGGLPAWHRRGGLLVGDLFALQDMKRVSSQTFFNEKNYTNGLEIDISSKRTQDSKQLLPSAVHLPFSGDVRGKRAARFQKKLKQIAKKSNTPFGSVMIFDQDGARYERIQAIFANTDLKIFYLKDGLAGYKKYLQNLALSRQPREKRTKKLIKCNNCGPAGNKQSSPKFESINASE